MTSCGYSSSSFSSWYSSDASRVEKEPHAMRPLSPTQRIDALLRNVEAHAATLSLFTNELSDVKRVLAQMAIDKAVRTEVDKGLNERLARIEKSIDTLTAAVDKRFQPYSKILIWGASILGGAFLLALAKFILAGSLLMVPPP